MMKWCERKVEEMMRLDPNTVEVVASMRSRNRTWLNIFNCFRKHMESLGINCNYDSARDKQE
jgi:hypothetical protein